VIDTTDWELIRACRQNDAHAWQALITRYERLVLSIPLRYGLTRDDAEDVAQLTFTNVLEGLGTFHAESNVKSWLITVARRNSWRVMERYDHEQVYGGGDLSESALALDMATNDETTDWHVLGLLHDGLQALDMRCRDLLIALYFEPEKLSYDAIAERFGMALNSVGAIRSRCLKRLRTLLSAEKTIHDR
jgi:RNA polymerase sigma factor (sigma-70 family)